MPSDIRLTPYPWVPESAKTEDPVAYSNMREQRAREIMIAIEMGKILKRRLQECYQREGVNHAVNCKHLADKVYALMQKPRYGALRGGPNEE